MNLQENSANKKEQGKTKEKNQPGSEMEMQTQSFPFHRSMRGKLILGLCSVLLLGILAILASTYAVWRMEDKIKIIEAFYELNQEVLEMRRSEKNFLLFHEKKDLMSALNYLDQVRESMARIKKNIPKRFEQMDPSYDIRLAEYERVFLQLVDVDISRWKKARLVEELRDRGHVFTSLLLDMNNRARKRVENLVRNYVKISFIILAVAVVLGMIFLIFLVHWIMSPMEAIRLAAARIMQGEMESIPIDKDIRESIESIELVNSLNKMLAALDAKQNQLIQSAKLVAIGKVTAGIAHEINNPLNNISLTAEVLLDDLPNLDCRERMEMVEDIVTQSERAREVVHHLLEFSRGQRTEAMVKVNLVQIVKDSLTLLKNQFRLSKIQQEVSQSQKEVIVHGDANQLKQVLVNMMLNAIQAMEPGGNLTLHISANNHTGKGIILVKDTGPGIPKEIQANIFDPFFTTKNSGTGLGLSLSHSIIREHDGEIQLESEIGKGTLFRILIPLAEPE
jgi:signal transduction histidine kinase